uniref:Radical SAM protein n=1 Tax=candidate division WOR-3 bacterium TaxID=2052148 RepID=A0A7C6AAL3_UNCW3
MAKKPITSRLLIKITLWLVRHRQKSFMLFSVIDAICQQLLRFWRRGPYPRLRQDGYFMLRALLFSSLRVRISEKTLQCLAQNIMSGTNKISSGAPGFLVLSPGKRCNLRCPDCYANSASENNILDFAVLNRIVTEAKEFWGVRFFVISGGEPFIYRSQGKGILDLAKAHPDSLFLVYTNGTLITEAVAKELAALANITPAISVEGMQKNTDARRGNGTFEKILQAMANLRAAQVPFGLSLTATRYNIPEILSDHFLDFFFNQQDAAYAWLFHYMPMGRNPNPDAMPTPEQRIWLWQRTWQIIKEKKIMIADFWNHGTVSQGCLSAGRSGGYFHIDWNGDITPCVFFPYASANINEIYQNGGNLNDVLATPLFRSIRQWQEDYGYQKRVLTDETDWLRPCPIRDHYEAAYRIIKQCNPKTTDSSPQGALTDWNYYNQMADYSQKLQKTINKIWQEEYLSN